MNQIKMIPKLTLITPCLNEESALPTLIMKVVPTLQKLTNGNWNIIVVDDGSTDDTFKVIRDLNKADKRITGISLSRNFGHQPAIATGLSYSTGEYTAIMDADLQDPVDTLEALFLEVAQNGYDVAIGVRGSRDAPFWLKIGYSSFYKLIRKFADHKWPLDAGDFSVFNRDVLNAILSLPERDRMLRGLRSWVGFNQTSVIYDRPARTQGQTKYNFFKLAGLAMTAFVGFTSLPLRIASLIGLLMSLASFGLTFLIILNRLFPAFTLFGYNIGVNSGTATLAVIISITSGMMFFCLGIIGEYVALLVREIKQRPTAIVQKTIGIDNKTPKSSSIFSIE